MCKFIHWSVVLDLYFTDVRYLQVISFLNSKYLVSVSYSGHFVKCFIVH